MRRITWDEFKEAWGDKVGESLLSEVDQHAYYFENGKQAWGIVPLDNDRLWLEVLVGKGMEWCRDLPAFMKVKGYKCLGFQTNKGNRPVERLAAYWKAKETKRVIENGVTKIIYWVNFHTRRLGDGWWKQ